MTKVTLAKNAFDPSEWTEHECDDVCAFLKDEFESWPQSARIYHGTVSQDCDVTPVDEAGIERLGTLPGPFTVVVYPGDPITIIIAVVAVVSLVAAFLLMPKAPQLDNRNPTSANNSLTSRANEPRPLGRVEDIYGTVRSTPSLVAVPYKVYEDHKELEIAYLCIGRGAYEVTDIKDGDTLVSDIDLASCAVYGPFTSPNDGSIPEIQIGGAIGDPVFNVKRLNEVNGQTLKPDNDETLRTNSDLTFVDGGIIRSASGTIDFTEYFQAGDFIEVGRADDPGGPTGNDAIQAAGTAHSGGFDFATYDPSTDWAAGQFMSVTGAVFQVDDTVGGGGDISGDTTYPGYPYNPYDRPDLA